MSEYSTDVHLTTLLERYGLAANEQAQRDFLAFARRQRYLGMAQMVTIAQHSAEAHLKPWEDAFGDLGQSAPIFTCEGWGVDV